MEDDLIEVFNNINVKVNNGKPNLYKPVLLLYALKKCYLGNERLISFNEINAALNITFKELFPNENNHNFHYAFKRLENDKVWEITKINILKRTSSGDLYKSELIEKNISGGFLEPIYQELFSDKYLIEKIYNIILEKYIDNRFHSSFQLIDFKNNPTNGVKRMTLMNNQGEPVSHWWITKGLKTIKTDREIFSSQNMRRARCEFIAGDNRLKTIKSWLVASQLIQGGRNSREYELTDFGFAILGNDTNLDKSSTWWAFHLSTCFSTVSEPYPNFFLQLDTISKDWINSKQLFSKIQNNLTSDNGDSYKDSTLESLISSVRRMFEHDRPLADLGLIEIRKAEDQIHIRLGSPKLTDEIIIHALAMMRFHCYKMRSGVDFSEIIAAGLGHFLCCSPEELRKQIWRMEQSNNWKEYFSFTNAVNLESVSFTERCNPRETVLLLLQSGEDTWL
ncbi:MAG: hypothetical protein U1D70_16805 [Methylobacter sp.]|nr:hypothetical protein [Methylobacter sp.]MDP2428209.1 hypothetical protein [Methylobacter sp.]MDP3055207.1 hypothetical protein [Methylobacter sp.]MDP3362518.1 hypothetical protein [Methylobacter sp.]MDZ4220665.1 hypothetical protein [Methylobacter sp.]